MCNKQDNNKPEILRWFHYEHLPEPLKSMSKQFHDLAHNLVENTQSSAEQTAGLRKLLEAKDCFVRCERQKIGGEPEKQNKLN